MKKIIHIALMLCALFLLAQNGASANSSPANDIIRQYNAEQKALKIQLNEGKITSEKFIKESEESAARAKAAQDALLDKNKTDTTPSGPGSAPENVSYGTIEKDSPSYGNNNYSQPSGPGYDAGSGSSGISSSGSYGNNGGEGSGSSGHYDTEIASIQSNCTRADRCVYEIQEVEDRRAGFNEDDPSSGSGEQTIGVISDSNDRYIDESDEPQDTGGLTDYTQPGIAKAGVGGTGITGAGRGGARVAGADEWTKGIQDGVEIQKQLAEQNPGNLAGAGGGSGGGSLLGGIGGSSLLGGNPLTSLAAKIPGVGDALKQVNGAMTQVNGAIGRVNQIGTTVTGFAQNPGSSIMALTGAPKIGAQISSFASGGINAIPKNLSGISGNLNLGNPSGIVAQVQQGAATAQKLATQTGTMISSAQTGIVKFTGGKLPGP